MRNDDHVEFRAETFQIEFFPLKKEIKMEEQEDNEAQNLRR